MPATAPTSTLRRLLDEPLARLLDECEPKFTGLVRSELGDSLNQAVRRMRQAGDANEVLATLLDAAGPFCEGGAVLQVVGDGLAPVRIRGVDPETAERFSALEMQSSAAAALAGAIESRDPVTAACSPGELSAGFCDLLARPEGCRVSIFPVVSGDKASALLVCWGAVANGTVELLAQTAGLALPVEAPPPAPALVSIAPAEPPAEPAAQSKARPAWDEMPAEEQRTHLRAQRFARVQASELRLRCADAVQAGRIHRDVYGALRDEIDAARAKFRSSFVETCPSMVDYLHLELVRTLANDQIALMGPEYPGTLA